MRTYRRRRGRRRETNGSTAITQSGRGCVLYLCFPRRAPSQTNKTSTPTVGVYLFGVVARDVTRKHSRVRSVHVACDQRNLHGVVTGGRRGRGGGGVINLVRKPMCIVYEV